MIIYASQRWSRERAIPLARCVFLVPFTSILDEAGAPTRSLLAKFHLPTDLEEKPNHYMPLLPALRFAATAQGSQGIVDFGFRAGMRLGFGALSESFQASVRHSPTLLTALRSWCRFAKLEDTFVQFWLERHEDSLKVCSASMIPGAAEMPLSALTSLADVSTQACARTAIRRAMTVGVKRIHAVNSDAWRLILHQSNSDGWAREGARPSPSSSSQVGA